MQTLQRISFKNNSLYQIQIILADIQAQTYNFMKKRNPRDSKIFTRKNEEVMLLFLYHTMGLHFPEAINSNNNESKYMFFLNASSKDWKRKRNILAPSFNG